MIVYFMYMYTASYNMNLRCCIRCLKNLQYIWDINNFIDTCIRAKIVYSVADIIYWLHVNIKGFIFVVFCANVY